MAEIPAIKRRLVAQGVDVIDLGAGDADFPPPELAVETLARAARDPAMSRYAFQLELEEVPADARRRAKLVYLNYPNNPTAAVATREYLERTVAFCRRHGIVIAYDNPYCEITFDDYVAPSIFEIAGAREVAVEFHSLSKTF